MVEFAITAFLFFMLIAALFDVGRGIWYQTTLQNAVQEGARYAMVHGASSSSPVGPGDGNYSAGPPSTDTTITNLVDKYLVGLKSSQVSVGSSWPGGSDADGQIVTVTASYPLTPIFKVWKWGTITLSASVSETIVH